jgi:hypothetical protein
MQDLYPRLGDICRINGRVMTSAHELSALKNVKLVDSFVIGENLAGEKVVVERDLVFPICIGLVESYYRRKVLRKKVMYFRDEEKKGRCGRHRHRS